MYTALDKAIVACVMGILGLIGVIWHPVNISPETVATVVSIVTPILVYLVPNLPKDTTT